MIAGGFVRVNVFDTEGIQTGVYMNVPANSGISSFHHLTGEAGCTDLLLRQGGSTANVNVVSMSVGCTHTLNNAGTVTTGNIIADVVFQRG